MGLQSKEIGKLLGRSKSTIDFHKKNIMKKTGCTNDIQLGMYAALYCSENKGKG
jgi:DNA-binding NarL/FixJ family response regulator